MLVQQINGTAPFLEHEHPEDSRLSDFQQKTPRAWQETGEDQGIQNKSLFYPDIKLGYELNGLTSDANLFPLFPKYWQY